MLGLITAAVFNPLNVLAQNQYSTFACEITQIDNNQYYGVGVNDESNIFFLGESVKQGEAIKIGDVIVAYFDPNNIEDGLLYVEKFNE
ncbi:hypothetical protein [Brevibacillus laterosporus]|uniref:hypothetical protein n=1 Tax=Brevibacillus laterosporus TaxID=1465 RepID=UPI002E1A8D3E|nr:hypothetical protein [Brevibacillus laterosporus]MED1667175.1 hypothetical protein [Brevibacillus laterosporus]MED1719757.1 hypothetical protein [Brevibacillus laterosporus]